MFYDTSTFVDYLRGERTAGLYFEQVRTASERPYCSVITETELWAGVRNDIEEMKVFEVLSRFNVIPVTSAIARLAGGLLRNVGEKRAHFGDAIIAASAMQIGETIFTADRVSETVFGNRATYLVYR